MLTLSPKYVTDEQGNRVSVLLSMDEYAQLLEHLEELQDIRLYDEVKSRQEERVPLTNYLQQRQTLKQHG